jgi:hypothetical protein
VFGVGLLGLGLYIFPVWLPLPGGFIQRVHYWWMDQVVSRWIAPRRLRFRRLMRIHPFWRIVRRPHRLAVRSSAARTAWRCIS